jgi:hypothetical protein
LTRYTGEELAQEGRRLGAKASKRLVDDWAGLGLLDYSAAPGLGRKKGRQIGTWPEAQRQLFLTLLERRKRGEKITALCNVPVWIWMYWGDSYVPPAQAKRALGTWAGRNQTAGWGTAQKTAKQLVTTLAHPKSSAADRRAAIEGIATMATSGNFDRVRVAALLQPVLQPEGTERRSGPLADIVTAQGYAELIQARLRVVDHLESLDDSLFEWARYFQITNYREYQRTQPALASDLHFGALASVPNLEDSFHSACEQLVTLLGLGLDLLDRPGDGSLRHPATWRDLGLRSVVHSVETVGGLQTRAEIVKGVKADSAVTS